jgi:hypothetical protein
MKKFFFFLILFFTFTIELFAQNQILTVGNNSNFMNETTLKFQNDNQTVIKFDLNQLELVEIETGYGNAFIPVSDKAPLMMQETSPELFYLTTSFIIPDRGGSQLEITYVGFQDFENIEIAPSKGNLLRSIDPKTVPFVKGDVYQIDGFYPGTLASLREPFIMRDIRGQSLDVYPIQYNPVTKILRVYSEITVTVINTQNEGINEFITQKRHKTIELSFAQMYNNMFINSSVLQSRGYPTGEEGELLIICHSAFMSDMKPYVDWKHKIGRKTTLVSTEDITPLTYANIKTYIQDYYNSNDNLAYVLLVGDFAQIPVYSYWIPPIPPYIPGQTCYQDIYYAQLTSSTYLDVLIGRMSAETSAHVQTQVQRSIWYERDINTSDTWLSKAIGLAANEGTGGHDGGEADHVHMNNIRNRFLVYGYDPVYQEYSNNAGVPTTNAAQISSRFNDGVGMANYCNHGDYDGWYLTQGYSYISYTNSHVNALTNAGKLPYIFSVACNNGEFPNKTCFAETWMRASKSGQPTGAVATFMATISISWQPPMTAQDEFVNICLDLPTPYSSWGEPGTKRTMAGAMLNASQKMRLKHGSSGNNDYNSWLVFGDPTLMFRTKTPEEMTISHLPTLLSGINEFSVECDVEGANATLSYVADNNEVVILGTAIVEDGMAVIIFEKPNGFYPEFTLSVTGFNKVTYLDIIMAGEIPELFPPQKLTYTVEKANHVILNWKAPEEGKNLNVKGYNIYRDDVQINTELIIDETSFTDFAPANDVYKYEVTAFYGTSLESEPSEPVEVLIEGMCLPIIDNIIVDETEGDNIFISWKAPKYEGTELSGYYIWRDDEIINPEIPTTELSFLDENVEIGTQYCYQIQVVYNDCIEDLIIITEKKCHKLSVSESPNAQSFSIFPNPATREFTISSFEFRITNVEIFDVYGRKLLLHTADRLPQTTIDVSHLQSGIYFIRIDSEQGSVTQKVIVKN